jgi:hypothetical protein
MPDGHVRYITQGEMDTNYWKVFNNVYMCRVQSIHLRSLEEIEAYGVPTTGDQGYDRGMAHEQVRVGLQIPKMIELYKRGVTIGVVDHEDTKRIYDLITAHLTDWANHIQTSLNNKDAPLEDLRWMDRFACSLYVHAKSYFDESMLNGTLARLLNNGFGRNSFLKPKEVQIANVPRDQDGAPKRESMESLFAGQTRESLHRSLGERKWR